MEVINLSKSFGEKKIFEELSLKFTDPVTAIMGPSGVGKTTLLRILAKLENCDGQVVRDDKISFVFQEGALIENLSALKNVEIACGDKGKALKAIEQVELTKDMHLYPKSLSGGMKQRVNLARAFASGGTILMDEPFKMLDPALKQRLIDLFAKVHKQEGNRVILVTHDVDEAMFLADRIIVLSKSPAQVVYNEKIARCDRDAILRISSTE